MNDLFDPPPRDPTSGLTPGLEIHSGTQYFKTCKECGESLLVGQVTDVYRAIHWRTFDAAPVEYGGRRYYRKHDCPARDRNVTRRSPFGSKR